MDPNFVLIALSVAAVAAAIIFQIWKKRHPRTVDSEKYRISKLLRRFAGPRRFVLIDHPTLVTNGLSGWADHILIGYFGVLLVYDLCFEGEYFGNPGEAKWKLISSGVKYEFDSPFVAADQCSGRVNTLLKDAGLKAPVSRVAVTTRGEKHMMSYIKTDEVVLYKKLYAYLGREKFGQDNGVDIRAVEQALRAALKEKVQPAGGGNG